MTRSLLLIAVVSIVTIALRFLPFVVFRDRTPQTVLYLGKVLPCAIMGMLVIYCLKDTAFTSLSGWAPQAISVALVVALHRLKHNTLLSILAGTVCYMLLVQLVFAA